ncbi:MAG TPA: TA system VapC family ribonuclease toxin [Gammaproteobacteria bacterium]|nr:TA system VapC family ribonuclease toxin [Gammaproteobacteria bacterium]
MIAVDTNILLYAHREDSDFHQPAVMCLQQLAEGNATWALPWPCLHEFFAIATHPRIYSPPTPMRQAIEQIEAWLESPSVVLLAESVEHWLTLKALLTGGKITGPQVHDARIAALCLQHGVRELWSLDRDFGRYAKLKVRNPLG